MRSAARGRGRRVGALAAAGAVLAAAGTGLAVGPAAAAGPLVPGSAISGAGGANLTVDLTVDGFHYDYTAENAVGEIDSIVEPHATSGTGASLVDLPAGEDWLTIDLGPYETSALADARAADAQAQATGVGLTLFGMPLVSVDRIAASGTCAVGGTPGGTSEVEGVTVLGQTLDPASDLPVGTVWRSGPVPVTGAGGLADLEVEVEVSRGVVVVGDTANSLGLGVAILLSGPTDDAVLDEEVIGTLALAGTICQTGPVQPVAITGVAPASGPSAGGQAVTLSGSGFSADTRLLVDGVDVTPQAIGPTSVVLVMPPHAPGRVTIVADNPGAAAQVDYTYVGAGGGGDTGGGSTGAKVLAATGSPDGAASAPWAAALALLLAGAALLGVRMLRGRRG